MYEIRCRYCREMNDNYRITCHKCGNFLTETPRVNIFDVSVNIDEFKWICKGYNDTDIYLSFVIVDEVREIYHVNIYFRSKDDKDTMFLYKTITYEEGVDSLSYIEEIIEKFFYSIM